MLASSYHSILPCYIDDWLDGSGLQNIVFISIGGTPKLLFPIMAKLSLRHFCS